MRLFLGLLILCGLLPGIAAAEVYRMQKAQILDRSGGSGFKAYDVLVPYGWAADGGVYWNAPCTSYGYELKWQATSPRKDEAVAVLPAVSWGTSKPAGCSDVRFERLVDVLAAQTRQVFKDITFNNYRERPDLIDRQLPTWDLGLNRSSFRSEAGELSFTATDYLGQRVRGIVVGKMVHVLTQTAGYNGVPPQSARGGIVDPTFFYAAKAEAFRPRMVEVVRKSIIPDPRWAQKMHRHHGETDRIRLKGNIQLMRLQNQFLRANSGLFSSFSQRDENGRWLDRERTEAIRGVETYLDRNGAEVQLDHTYPHAWDLGDRTYLITNDPNFDPNVGTTLQGVRMRRAP